VAKVKSALRAVKKAGVTLQVGFNRRFDHNFRRVRDLVVSGAIGAPHIVKITSRDPAPPPPSYVAGSGGIFLDMMIHDFDMARFQAGSEVVEVFAQGAVLVDEGIGKAGDVDTAIVTLRFANGALGVIDNSRKAVYGYDQRVEVFGSGGRGRGRERPPTTGDAGERVGRLRRQAAAASSSNATKDAFVPRCARSWSAWRAPAPVTGEDGLQDLFVALAAKKSLAEGRPVKLSEVS
jgi:myo-inositol 2-dehydrogenase/D-chiro-inositol 1-dehydrogenase